MISTRDTVDLIAGRIERAYRRRYPQWPGIGMTPGAWESAASRLLEVSTASTKIPIDPELYVAAQPKAGNTPDPWSELTQRRSRTRYIHALRQIVAQLRRELKGEVRLAERRMFGGMSLEEALDPGQGRISPLTCYILAFRAGRFDLSFKHRAAAESQHRSCPLYRQASRILLPNHAYPCDELAADPHRVGHEIMQFSVN